MEVFTAIAALVGMPVLLTLASMLNGWVLTVLWGWFMVPTFHLPELRVAPAIGLAYVVGFLTDATPSEHEKSSSCSYILMSMVVRPVIALFFGWIVSRFM